MTRALYALSLDVVAYERCAESVQSAMRELPDVEFHCWKHDGQYLGNVREFDFVLVHDSPEFKQNWLSERSLRTTVDLASCVQPGGTLLFLLRHDPVDGVEHRGHLPSCCSRLLSLFPGTTQTTLLPDSFRDQRTWNWFLGRQFRSGDLVVSLRLPETPIVQVEWQRFVERELQHPREPCCLRARASRNENIRLRRAA